jgi:hypothetical protein
MQVSVLLTEYFDFVNILTQKDVFILFQVF